MPKINNSGEYTPHPGVTIIASARKADMALWTQIRNALTSSEAAAYFAFTPVESYHMTVCNLFTEHQIGKRKWKRFITENLSFFTTLNDSFSSHETIDCNVIKLQVIDGGTIRLVLEPTPEQIAMHNNMTKIFGIDQGTPGVYHVTLGHSYRTMGAKEKKAVTKHLAKEISEILLTQSEKLSFSSPRLTYFEDMTKFTPWSGTSYPFKESFALIHPLINFLFTTPKAETAISSRLGLNGASKPY